MVTMGAIERLHALLAGWKEDGALVPSVCVVLCNLAMEPSAVQAMVACGVPRELVAILGSGDPSVSDTAIKGVLLVAKNLALTNAGAAGLVRHGLPDAVAAVATIDDADARAGAVQVLLNVSCCAAARAEVAAALPRVLDHVAYELPVRGVPMSYPVLETLGRVMDQCTQGEKGRETLAQQRPMRATAAVVLALVDPKPPPQFAGSDDAKHRARLVFSEVLRRLKETDGSVVDEVADSMVRAASAVATALETSGDNDAAGAGK